ncbi:helix-turn-helix transcriptional regulator [Candidatus Viridilinea mediisalina]|uniref:TrmB family transcriptional regulator n=1 Tax=Candidatus Viridilinea mediisalina TaxID=2024553 RepID=A0A2A6RIU4_9CHLR|nr:HTH domain-containing protein [Candidatus Viridilinea mediisalina]PDW02805.1 TrmB family transcriptional regulator [Candidatus Viridilinea mediisalina]
MIVIGYATTSAPGQILQHLQRQGEATVKELAAMLGVSTTAAREHIVHLQAEGLVVARTERYGPGRPRLVYALSDEARGRFPQQYDRLITGLIRELIALEGPDKLEQLLERVSRRLAHEYSDRMAGHGVTERLAELRRLLEQRGVPAEIAAAGDGISLFACPFYDVAQDYPEVCSMERQMIEFVLGEKLALESSIREGGHTCRFVVQSETIPLKTS